MACYSPLHAFDIGTRTAKGKVKYMIVGGDVSCVPNQIGDAVQIPCGLCIGCRLDYSRQWAHRCVFEAKSHDFNAYLTLTYDDPNLVWGDAGHPTLVPDHLTTFMKDLRRYWKYHFNFDGLRFFGCGEYGDVTHRPHYHLIVFGLNIPDLQFYGINAQGDKLYNSPILSKVWGRGFVVVGNVNWRTAAYVARYVVKKRKGKTAKAEYDRVGLVPEFVRMSRNPGIATEYYNSNSDMIYATDECFVSVGDEVIKVKPPKFFDRKFELENPDRLNELRVVRRERAIATHDLEMEHTDLDKFDYAGIKLKKKFNDVRNLVKTSV